jgi:hypothetical protein
VIALVSLGTYLVGAGCFLVVVAASATVGVIAVRRRAELEAPYRVVGGVTIAVAALVVIHLVPGALGVLGRGTVVATALVVAAATVVADRRWRPTVPSPPVRRPTDERRESWAEWAAPVVGVIAVLAFALAFLDHRRATAIDEVDSLMFHLPQVARWIQSHRFWQLDDFAPGWAFGNYPNTGNVLQLAVVLPWRDDAFVRFVNLPLLVLSGTAVATTAWELGVRRSTAAVAGAAAIAVPVLLQVSLNAANTDTLAYAGFAVGGAFAVRATRSGRRADLAYAGIGFGLAFGTKWYGVTSAVALAVPWLAWRLWRAGRERWRSTLADAVAIGAGSVILGGYWLVRNLVLSDNPVFPVRVAIGPLVVFDAPYDHVRAALGYSLAHYLGDGRVLRDFVWLGFRVLFSWIGALALAGLVVAAVVAVRRRAGVVLAVAGAAALLLAVYVVTPYTAMGPAGRPFLLGAAARYAGPALALALPAAAWAAGRVPTRVLPLVHWVVAIAVLDGIRRCADLFGVSVGDVGRAKLAVAALVCVGATVAAVVVWPRLRSRRTQIAVAALATAALVAVVGVGRVVQRDYDAGRYVGVDPVYDAVLATPAATHRVVGLAGAYGGVDPPPLILHGDRFVNRVVYVGQRVGGRLERYSDGAAFARALRHDDVDQLVVALGAPGEPEPDPNEARWARAAGWREVVRSPRLALYERESQ